MNSIITKPWGYFEVLASGQKFLVKKILRLEQLYMIIFL